ncbi:MAG: 2-oxo acid dehydrogenase subunit E2 [Robiginitomaculum sp.]|nr:2-oxo acid dehydrogenase subunit E2 [Robiginitomaculum sp.]
MGQVKFKMPDVGEGVVEAEIVEWHVTVGQKVQEDDTLVDVMTDKATVEIPAPVTGVISALNGEPGDVLAIGSVLLVIETDGDDGEEEPADKPEPIPVSKPEPAPEPKTEPAKPATPAPVAAPAVTTSTNAKPLASPAVRKRALEQDVDLSQVPSKDPAGRISHQNLDDFIASGGRLTVTGTKGQKREGQTSHKVIGLRRKIGQNLSASKRNIPHFSYVEEIEMDALEDLRKHLNDTRQDGQNKLNPLPFLGLALIKVLPDFAQANAHFDGEVVTEFAPVHLGVATATPNGLMVAVVRHAEAMDIWTLAAEIARVTKATRDGKATKDELTGSTITITSLGALGGIASTPVINAPETAIIGVNKLTEKLVLDRGNVVARKVMNLSSSFDHRIVDGFDAARMIAQVKSALENPATLFM